MTASYYEGVYHSLRVQVAVLEKKIIKPPSSRSLYYDNHCLCFSAESKLMQEKIHFYTNTSLFFHGSNTMNEGQYLTHQE